MTGSRVWREWIAAAGIVACAGWGAASADPPQGSPPTQRGGQAEAEVHHDTSPPLWLMTPAAPQVGQRVHRVLPLPRPGRGQASPGSPVVPVNVPPTIPATIAS